MVPFGNTWKWMSAMSFPFATTLRTFEDPSVQNALAPVMFRTMPVTFPAGTFDAPNRSALPCSLVMFTFVPTLPGT